jgi:hypothetical protein
LSIEIEEIQESMEIALDYDRQHYSVEVEEDDVGASNAGATSLGDVHENQD